MTGARRIAPAPRVAKASAPPMQAMANGLVFAAVLFNAFLALVNANLAHINSAAVIGCEGLIDAMAIGLCLLNPDPRKMGWLTLMAALTFLNLINGVLSGAIDPKFLRDVLIIPIFAMLGLMSDRDNAIRVIVRLQWVVLAVMLFEAVSPEGYGRVFGVMSYYINTRGFDEAQFWSKDTTDLFVSASRPGERYLMAFLNIHRLSSVFLEPVSLGNYCVIVVMAVIALWDRMGLRDRAFLVVSTAMMVVGCDGRFASTSIVIMIGLRLVAPLLPRYANVLYLPGILLLSAFAVGFLHLRAGGDDFPTRTAGSMAMLSEMDFTALFGAAGPHAYEVMDSGIAYLLYSQSLIGASIVWATMCFGLPQRDRATLVFAHSVSVYIALNLLVSYSLFSVKTAGLLWFLTGSLANVRTVPVVFQVSAPPWWRKIWSRLALAE